MKGEKVYLFSKETPMSFQNILVWCFIKLINSMVVSFFYKCNLAPILIILSGHCEDMRQWSFQATEPSFIITPRSLSLRCHHKRVARFKSQTEWTPQQLKSISCTWHLRCPHEPTRTRTAHRRWRRCACRTSS